MVVTSKVGQGPASIWTHPDFLTTRRSCCNSLGALRVYEYALNNSMRTFAYRRIAPIYACSLGANALSYA